MKMSREWIGNMSLEEIIKDIVKSGMERVSMGRKCPSVSDEEFTMHGIMRVFEESSSGREFIQQLFDFGIVNGGKNCEWSKYISPSTYFDSLSSGRRMSFMNEISTEIFHYLSSLVYELPGIDYFSGFEELRGRGVFSGDGHYISAAVHTKEINGKRPVPGCIYLQDMRSGFIFPLCQIENQISSRPHEIKFLRDHISLLKNYGKGKLPPVFVYDRAATDNKFWSIFQNVRKGGVAIVTRMKENMKFTLSEPLEFDRNDRINEGVTDYRLCTVANGGILYLVWYTDPETSKEFVFLTNDKSLRPGVVAMLYKWRWKIEKVFDVLKNKLHEKKAWATSTQAHRIQSLFISIVYNITHFFRIIMEKLFDIQDEISAQKREKRILNSFRQQENSIRKNQEKKESQTQLPICHSIALSVSHIHQISHRIIRFIRNIFRNHRFVKIFQLIPALEYHMKAKNSIPVQPMLMPSNST